MWNFGDTVKVRAFIDGVVERRVIGSGFGKVYVCKESEFQSALKENREPVGMGFPLADIVEKTVENPADATIRH